MQVQLIANQTTESGNFTMTFAANLTKANFSLVLGTLLNDVFSYMAAAKKHRACSFKSNEILDVKIIAGDVSIDTSKATTDYVKNLRASLKVRNNARSKHAFAVLVADMFDYMTREVVQITLEQLLEQLANEATADIITKQWAKAELN